VSQSENRDDEPNCFEVCPCGPPGRFWVNAEYLLWWIKNSDLPPLVTASSISSGGALNHPDTVVLFGGSVDNEERSGGRFTAGYWLDCDQTIGIEAGYFFLGSRSVNFTAGSSTPGTTTVIGRPFFNVVSGMEDSELIVAPNLTGTVHVSSSSRLQGAEVNGICNICCGCCYRVDLLGGFRYLQLDEGLGMHEDLAVPLTVPLLGGQTLGVTDQFGAHNRFYGGQVGAVAEYRRGEYFVDLLGKVALGDMHQVIDIDGSTVFGLPLSGGAPMVAKGGLLALPSNIGQFSRDRFAVVPEVDINVGYQVTPHLRAYVGYSFLYSSSVVRPGDQIDLHVNPLQLPLLRALPGGAIPVVGPARPAVVFKDTDFWAQGISLGLEFQF
jgi:hypothetical protein